MGNYYLYHTDAISGISKLNPQSIDCIVTSPPYWLQRDYECENQIGWEETPSEYIKNLTDVFRVARYTLKPAGTMFVNIGDTYAGYWGDNTAILSGERPKADTNKWTRGYRINQRPRFHQAFDELNIKNKDMVGIPWMLAFALRDSGWFLRSEIIWHKERFKAETVRDRSWKAHEHVFLFSKSARYSYAQGEERGSVWKFPKATYYTKHIASMPEELAERCVSSGCPEGGTVLDPFCGSSTVGIVSLRLGRSYIGMDASAEAIKMSKERLG